MVQVSHSWMKWRSGWSYTQKEALLSWLMFPPFTPLFWGNHYSFKWWFQFSSSEDSHFSQYRLCLFPDWLVVDVIFWLPDLLEAAACFHCPPTSLFLFDKSIALWLVLYLVAKTFVLFFLCWGSNFRALQRLETSFSKEQIHGTPLHAPLQGHFKHCIIQFNEQSPKVLDKCMTQLCYQLWRSLCSSDGRFIYLESHEPQIMSFGFTLHRIRLASASFFSCFFLHHFHMSSVFPFAFSR